MTTIPADPTELTPEWLTAVLRASGAIGTSAVTNLTTEVIGAERGFTGVVARVELAYDQPEPGAPSSLVAKFPLAQPTGSSYRESQQAQRHFERCAREVQFYREIAGYNDLVPAVYGAWADAGTGRMLILLEDLSDGEPGDALLGCSVEQAALVIERLATFHAGGWGRSVRWLPHWGGDPLERAERFRNQLDTVFDRYHERISAPIARLSQELAEQSEAVLQALTATPATVIHGDLHLDNLIFTPEEGVALIDWQSVSAGPAIVDLGLFIVGSLSVDDRRAAEFDMLARYHASLTAAGVRDYTLVDLTTDYRRSLVWQLAGITGWLARVDLSSLEGRERALVEALFVPGQVFTACVDHVEWLV